jgi:hypothetical protein
MHLPLSAPDEHIATLERSKDDYVHSQCLGRLACLLLDDLVPDNDLFTYLHLRLAFIIRISEVN